MAADMIPVNVRGNSCNQRVRQRQDDIFIIASRFPIRYQSTDFAQH